MRKSLLSFILLALLLLSLGQPASAQSSSTQSVIDKYRTLIPAEMHKQNIPGMAVAVVDDGQVVWSQGFGFTDWDGKTPVTADTPFSIQSMSKSFTALAVLLAAQDGLVDLDTPLSRYLPDFHLNSIFEERPEDKITLRHLLSHTAGFTHDAPVGNNNDLDPGTWQQHIASIAGTWLLFPVGARYGYSNNGVDLAGYIVETRAGMPFQQYVKTRLLDPLGMTRSTFDIDAIRALPDRAIGHSLFFRQTPLVTMMPSGGLYSTTNDMARYLLFYLNQGRASDRQLLAADAIKSMFVGQFPATAYAGYGLGLAFWRDEATGAMRVNHNGAGFGFQSQMTWDPEMKYGVVWMSNTSDHNLQSWLGDQILADYFQANKDRLTRRAAQAGRVQPKSFGPDDPTRLLDESLVALIQSKGQPAAVEALARWKSYTGTYGLATWGRTLQLFEVRLANDHLTMNGQPLTEVQPGLLFAADGEALDLRGPVIRLKAYRAEKLNSGLLLFYRVVLALFGLACVAMLLWPLVAWLIRLVRRKPATAKPDGWARAAGVLLWLAALVGLVVSGGLRQYPFLVLGGMPFPTRNLPSLQKAFLFSPYLMLGLAIIAAISLAFAWKQDKRWTEVAKAGVLVVFAIVVI